MFHAPAQTEIADHIAEHYHCAGGACSPAQGSVSHRCSSRRLVIAHKLLALGPQRQVFTGFLVEPLAVIVVEDSLPHHAPRCFWTEIILSVEALHPLHQSPPLEPSVANVPPFVPALFH